MESRTKAGALREHSRVLVLASSTTAPADAVCDDLLVTAPAADLRVLEIAYERRPAEIVDAWRRRHDALPAALAIVCPDARHDDGTVLPETVHVTTVAPADLTGVSIAVSRYLDRWDDAGVPTAACLDSLSALLQYADQDRVFRFLHTLTGRFAAAGATGHVHLDPATQDEQTIATLATLFDSLVRYDDGEWTVKRS
ncbi:MAG: hypothetical protein ABEJ31_09555 [Haloarculaceae archaeon]